MSFNISIVLFYGAKIIRMIAKRWQWRGGIFAYTLLFL